HDSHDDHGSAIGGPHADLWKTVNFLALIGIAAYMLRGKVAPFFEERNKSIASGMSDALARENDAQARLQQVEGKLAGLEAEIARLREMAQTEMERDRERVEAETAQALGRIQEHTTREIASAGAMARTQLRHHAAALALELAEQQVRSRSAEPGMQDILLAQAIQRLSQAGGASKN
ncbi:MAG: ATP synthase F0 subunit B, partial [Bryobacterales bacterium]|nr:ATP synthase F0 subunit B [Bryobacterales bacterium]